MKGLLAIIRTLPLRQQTEGWWMQTLIVGVSRRMSRVVTKSLKSLPTMTSFRFISVPVPVSVLALVDLGGVFVVCTCWLQRNKGTIKKKNEESNRRTFVLFAPVTSSRGV